MRRCPNCDKEVAPRAKNRAFPFCSDRCKLVDLGKWLGEEYRVPGRAEENEDETPMLPNQPRDDGDAS